jgi:hypothetical protein
MEKLLLCDTFFGAFGKNKWQVQGQIGNGKKDTYKKENLGIDNQRSESSV